MDYDNGFILQKTVDWSLLNDGMTIPVSMCSLFKAWDETDEERTYFLINIPCLPEFMKETLSVEQIGVKGGVKDGVKELSDIQEVIVKEMLFDPSVTTSEMAQKTGIKFRTLQRHISQLQAMGVVVRKDERRDGQHD